MVPPVWGGLENTEIVPPVQGRLQAWTQNGSLPYSTTSTLNPKEKGTSGLFLVITLIFISIPTIFISVLRKLKAAKLISQVTCWISWKINLWAFIPCLYPGSKFWEAELLGGIRAGHLCRFVFCTVGLSIHQMDLLFSSLIWSVVLGRTEKLNIVITNWEFWP